MNLFTRWPIWIASFLILTLAACSDDNSLRSPDLPDAQVTAIGQVSCSPSQIAVGQTGLCRVVGLCTFRQATASGGRREFTGSCPSDTQFVSANPGVAPVDEDGAIRGTSPGITLITAVVGGVSSPPVEVAVSAACVETVTISPANATLIGGQTQAFTTELTFTNGGTENVSSQSTFESTNTDIVTFVGNVATVADVVTTDTVTVTGTYTGLAELCPGVSATATTSLTATPAQLIAGGLCIETIPPAMAFGDASCRPDSGACGSSLLEFALAMPTQTRQLLVRGRFNNGLECDLTDRTELATDPTGVIAIDEAGLATAVDAGSTNIVATFEGETSTRPASVVVNQVLGRNSVAVSAKNLIGGEPITFANAQRFACVGANDLVSGLAGGNLRGFLETYAFSRTCNANLIDDEGFCTAGVVDDDGEPVIDPETGLQQRNAMAFNKLPLDIEVTNLPSSNPEDPLDDGIIWRAEVGFWDGEACQVSGSTDPEEETAPAQVGDLFIDPRVLQLANGIPIGDPSMQPNGLAYADAALRLGFACITATREGGDLPPGQSQTDGMTILVLPVTSDALLGPSQEAARLCDTLLPVFSNPLLGGLPIPGLNTLQLINVLSAVTEVVNPVLELLDVLPIDVVLTTLLDGAGPIPGLTSLTALIVNPIEGALIDPLLEPLICRVTSGVNFLLGIITGGGNNQECPDFGFP